MENFFHNTRLQEGIEMFARQLQTYLYHVSSMQSYGKNDSLPHQNQIQRSIFKKPIRIYWEKVMQPSAFEFYWFMEKENSYK